MKKLNFKLGGILEALTKDQMKSIKGGESGYCENECIDGGYCGNRPELTCKQVACGGQELFWMCV